MIAGVIGPHTPLGEAFEASVGEDADAALGTTHDRSDVGDRQIGDHAQQHGFGLIGWEPPDEFDGPIERSGTLGVDVGARCRPGLALALEDLVAVAPPSVASDLVDATPGGDREEPSAELVRVAIERGQAAGDLDPHRRRDVVRIVHALAAEVAEQEVLMRAPELAEGVAVARCSSHDHIVHRPSIGHTRRSA